MGDLPPAVSPPRIAQSSDRSEPTRFRFKNALPKAPRRSAYVAENANVCLYLGELANQLHHRPEEIRCGENSLAIYCLGVLLSISKKFS